MNVGQTIMAGRTAAIANGIAAAKPAHQMVAAGTAQSPPAGKEGVMHLTYPLVRWLMRRDVPELLGLESRKPDSWSDRVYLKHLQTDNHCGLVVEEPGIRGAMICREDREKIVVIRMVGEHRELLHSWLFWKTAGQKPIEMAVPQEDAMETAFLKELGYETQETFCCVFTEEWMVRLLYEGSVKC